MLATQNFTEEQADISRAKLRRRLLEEIAVHETVASQHILSHGRPTQQIIIVRKTALVAKLKPTLWGARDDSQSSITDGVSTC